MSVATLPLDYPAIKVNRAFATWMRRRRLHWKSTFSISWKDRIGAATVVSSSRATISKL
jgi:hypothetical protein